MEFSRIKVQIPKNPIHNLSQKLHNLCLKVPVIAMYALTCSNSRCFLRKIVKKINARIKFLKEFSRIKVQIPKNPIHNFSQKLHNLGLLVLVLPMYALTCSNYRCFLRKIVIKINARIKFLKEFSRIKVQIPKNPDFSFSRNFRTCFAKCLPFRCMH